MKKYTLLLVSILFLFNAQRLIAQCVVDAGEDVEHCGDTLQLNASLNEGDYDASWSTSSSEIEILDVNSPTSQVVLTDGFISSNTYSYDLIWTITNADGLTCSESANIIFKIIPSCEFLMDDTICSGSTSEIEYVYDISFNPCPSINDLIFDNDLIYGTNFSIQCTANPCIYDLILNNTTGEALTYLVGLQFEYNGCLSDLCEEYVTVLPEIIAFAGNDTTICGNEYTLNGELGNSESHVQWIYCSGPMFTFPNNDAGNDSVSGNPEAEIIAQDPGLVTLCWKERVGDCVYNDVVLINFLDTNYCNLLSADADIVMPSSELENDGNIDLTPIGGESPYMYNWSNTQEENYENEDQEELTVGLYTLTLTDNNDQQHIKHNYLVSDIDSTSYENPIDTLDSTIENCEHFQWQNDEIYNYVVVDDEIIVTWKFSYLINPTNEYSNFVTVSYPFVNSTAGFYVYSLTIFCENNDIEYTAQDIIYMDFSIMTRLNNKDLFDGKIYPNPTDGLVNIDAKDVFEMVMTDITGRVISNKIQTNTNGKSQIDLSNQKSGIYLLHLKTKDGQQVVKLIKE